jgi:DNA recombination protein RmuC
MDSTALTALLVALLVGAVIGLLAGILWGRTRAATGEQAVLQSRAAEQAVVRHGLESLEQQLRALQDHRVSWQAQLQQQVQDVRHSTDLLRRETTALSTALRRPQVRGRWGELHLRRAVELAGLVARCDFDEQVSVRDGDTTLRPDMVVHLAGGKQVVVDAKVPLDAFLDATECDDASPEAADERAAHLARHARQFRHHVDTLAAKSYWRTLPCSPEFVVLFVPGESFLSAALESDPSLLEHAAERRVVLATPTTLIALLRTVAHGWTQDALADKARDIHRLGRELHDRLGTMTGHLDRVGRSLGAAVASYNQAVGSLESRVLVSARRLAELEVTDEELPSPRPVEVAPRSPQPDAPVEVQVDELVELVEDQRSGALGAAPTGSGQGSRPGPRLGVASEESA